MIVLDTSSLIRFFTDDEPNKTSEVKSLLENGATILIPDVVFPELHFVLLGSIYRVPRYKVLEAFKFLVSQKNILVSPEVRRAIEVYEGSKLDMADCIIAAKSIPLDSRLASFDKKLLETKGIKGYWKNY